jgi:hypothetical protein
MANPSNLYAEKIYSEHPLVLWALDDQADYISLISEAERDIAAEWDISGCTAVEDVLGNEPFSESISTRLAGSIPVGATNDLICISPNLVNFNNLNSTLSTFSVVAYFYSQSPYLQSVSIGYEYTDTTTSTIVQEFKTFPTTVFESWAFVSGTFEIPNENTDLRAVIKITTAAGGASSLDYRFHINGFTIGQWAEEFNATSLGVTPESFPASIALTTSSEVIPAAAYGISSDEAYYLVNDNALVAKNSSVPMVFGASGVTTLSPNTIDEPSLIVPGKGFLNELGRYKEQTIEFWARINSNTKTPKRIFGPISSVDGLYVESGFLTLVVGNNFASHFVGEWFRPMLIHIRLIRNSATVLINGEEVISMIINTETLDLPLPKVNSKSQDWLGFYAYQDVTPIEIDCVAIYPYQVPVTVAKRRWVYGQGVLSPEGINSAYGGTSAFIDYPFADYTANYNYPDFAEWQQGSFDNLTTTDTAITTPNYQLPEIFLDTKTLQELYDDCQVVQVGYNESTDPSYKFITFRPNNSWNSEQCYFNFPNFNILNNQVRSIYGVFSTTDLDAQSGPTIQGQTLIKIYNSLTGDYFIITQEEDVVKYILNYNGIDQELYTTASIESNQFFSVGIDITAITSAFGENVSAFFGNQNGLKIYVAGDEEALNTFTGKIYSFGLSTATNFVDIDVYFNEDGIAIFDDMSESGVLEETNAIALIEHTASYTLLPTEAYNKFFLDIGVSGYWQDYLPLSYFAQYVANDVGNQFYDLDFLQFNIGYPAPSESAESETVSPSWTYGELQDEYATPSQRTYYQLDNFLFTGWRNYADMAEKSIKAYEYDTEGASVRSYITFQYIALGANLPQSSFTTTVNPTSKRIIDMNDYPSWLSTKFEVVDNTLIYPTNTEDFNDLAIVYHLEFNIRNILTKPIALRRLELASQAFNNNSFNAVGTRFGVNMFPYTRSGLYYDYKAKNPFSIYKGSTPYLYLNRKTGIEIRGDFASQVNRGIAIPINESTANPYKVSAAQIWMRYDEDFFPNTPTELFEVVHKDDTIKFYMVADSETGARGRIFARNQSTGQDFNGLSYFLNGNLVREPVITKKEWAVLGLAFSTALNFDSFLGAINLTGPMIFNNIAYYQANNLQQVQSTLNRPWLKVKTDGVTNFDWEFWLNSFTWEGVLVISASDLYGISPADIYKTYVGTNKIIVDDEEGMIFDAEKIKIYNNTVWQTTVQIPV